MCSQFNGIVVPPRRMQKFLRFSPQPNHLSLTATESLRKQEGSRLKSWLPTAKWNVPSARPKWISVKGSRNLLKASIYVHSSECDPVECARLIGECVHLSEKSKRSVSLDRSMPSTSATIGHAEQAEAVAPPEETPKEKAAQEVAPPVSTSIESSAKRHLDVSSANAENEPPMKKASKSVRFNEAANKVKSIPAICRPQPAPEKPRLNPPLPLLPSNRSLPHVPQASKDVTVCRIDLPKPLLGLKSVPKLDDFLFHMLTWNPRWLEEHGKWFSHCLRLNDSLRDWYINWFIHCYFSPEIHTHLVYIILKWTLLLTLRVEFLSLQKPMRGSTLAQSLCPQWLKRRHPYCPPTTISMIMLQQWLRYCCWRHGAQWVRYHYLR